MHMLTPFQIARQDSQANADVGLLFTRHLRLSRAQRRGKELGEYADCVVDDTLVSTNDGGV